MRAEVRSLSLMSFLIKPLQRITRYPLLLKVPLHNSSSPACKLIGYTGNPEIYQFYPRGLSWAYGGPRANDEFSRFC